MMNSEFFLPRLVTLPKLIKKTVFNKKKKYIYDSIGFRLYCI